MKDNLKLFSTDLKQLFFECLQREDELSTDSTPPTTTITTKNIIIKEQAEGKNEIFMQSTSADKSL